MGKISISMFCCLKKSKEYLQILVPIAPIIDSRNVSRFPYRRANGCQNSKLHPRNKNMYPVPSFSVDTETPDASERGTRTE